MSAIDDLAVSMKFNLILQLASEVCSATKTVLKWLFRRSISRNAFSLCQKAIRSVKRMQAALIAGDNVELSNGCILLSNRHLSSSRLPNQGISRQLNPVQITSYMKSKAFYRRILLNFWFQI